MIMNRKRAIIAAMASTVVTMVVGGAVAVADCAPQAEVDVWELELVDVTVDGESVDALDEYEGLSFELSNDLDYGVRLAVEGEHEEDDYSLFFEREQIPSEFESANTNDGGDS